MVQPCRQYQYAIMQHYKGSSLPLMLVNRQARAKVERSKIPSLRETCSEV
jgi:hypothetical protein